jgi:hypothetical protein
MPDLNLTPNQLRRMADILETNSDQPGFDFYSALAAVEAEDLSGSDANGVLVLTIDHDHGFEVSVHHSHKGAMATVADWVAESWERDGPAGEMPADTEEAIEAYFDFAADETYHISPAKIAH